MRALRSFLLVFPFAAGLLFAQTPSPGTIQASGSATIKAQPDQAQLTMGVVTQGTTAQEAAQSNATQTTAVLSALNAIVGNSGTVQTIGYSVSPRYNNATPAAIIGYTATNTLQVTTTNLNQVGSIIDAGNTAGANNISGVGFGLQNPDPTVQQALSLAAKQAVAHARAIASGLGANAGAIVSAQEGATYAQVVSSGSAGMAATTPIQTGTVNVNATVTVTVELVH